MSNLIYEAGHYYVGGSLCRDPIQQGDHLEFHWAEPNVWVRGTVSFEPDGGQPILYSSFYERSFLLSGMAVRWPASKDRLLFRASHKARKQRIDIYEENMSGGLYFCWNGKFEGAKGSREETFRYLKGRMMRRSDWQIDVDTLEEFQ